jgi:hypothetical protein
MKQFSSEAYFIVGFVGGGCRKHNEVRFLTERGAMRHARRLLKVLRNDPLLRDMVVFIDHVGVMGVHTHHREEEGTNRRPWREVDVLGRVWVHTGMGWEHQTMI